MIGGWFKLSFSGVMTQSLKFNSSAFEIKSALSALGNIGDTTVTRSQIEGGINAYSWNIVFLEYIGNVPLLKSHNHLTCSDDFAYSSALVTERVSGVLPPMDSRYSGHVELNVSNMANGYLTFIIEDLSKEHGYHIRVSAWNGVLAIRMG